jgi:nucleoside-diphosphate-sugar epimerase
MKSVLITGGAGFIGTHLMLRLAPECRVTIIDNFHRDALQFVDEARRSSVNVITSDVLDNSRLAASMEGVDCVFHLAAIAGVSSYYAQPARTLEVNLLGTMNVVKAAIAAGVSRLVYLSTSEIYGSHAVRVTEDSPAAVGPVTNPRWVYAISKLAGEQAVMHLCESGGVAHTIVRPFNIYGPRQVGEGAISNFCSAATDSKPLMVYGDGAAVRAWCYISDFIDALVAVMKSDSGRNRVFNVGNPGAVDTSIGLARRVCRIAGGGEIGWKNLDRADVDVRLPVIDEIRSAVGYEPKVDLDEGISKTLEWFRSKTVLAKSSGGAR